MISETSSKEHTITKKSNENKKYYKIIVRNLPPRDFIEEDFDKCIQSACLELQKTFGNSLEGPIMTKSNFVTGKVSRKRGPVHGTGYITIYDEAIMKAFLSKYPHNIPFIDDKSGVESQPEISLAPYQIPYRTKRRVDNYCGKIESDPDFLKWSAEQGVAVAKKPSAEVQLEKLIQEAAAVSAPTSKGRNGKPPPPPPPPITSFTALSSKNDPKSSALLKYMKEMGEKRALKKKQARALKLAAKGDAAPKEKSRKARDREKDREGDRAKERKSRKEKREKKEAASSDAAGGSAVSGDIRKIITKPDANAGAGPGSKKEGGRGGGTSGRGRGKGEGRGSKGGRGDVPMTTSTRGQNQAPQAQPFQPHAQTRQIQPQPFQPPAQGLFTAGVPTPSIQIMKRGVENPPNA